MYENIVVQLKNTTFPNSRCATCQVLTKILEAKLCRKTIEAAID